MKAVLQSRDMPVEKLDELMPAYADWLLTANKVHENGRPMNRWALMTAFVQMLIERGDLVVGHTVPRV